MVIKHIKFPPLLDSPLSDKTDDTQNLETSPFNSQHRTHVDLIMAGKVTVKLATSLPWSGDGTLSNFSSLQPKEPRGRRVNWRYKQ